MQPDDGGYCAVVPGSRVIGHLAFPGTIPTFWLTAESYKRSDWLLFIKVHYDL